MHRKLTILLAIVAIACIAGALYYPINYRVARMTNEAQLNKLRTERRSALESADPPVLADEAEATTANTAGKPDDAEPAANTDGEPTRSMDAKERVETPAADVVQPELRADAPAPDGTNGSEAPSVPRSADSLQPEATKADASNAANGAQPDGEAPPEPIQGRGADVSGGENGRPDAVPARAFDEATISTAPSAGAEQSDPTGPLSYYEKPHVTLDESRILKQYRDLYAKNSDLAGWLLIDSMNIDYPVMQTPGDDAYYLHRNFYGGYNYNGQLILDGACDPYTPSYNLIIYGHNMNNGTMFGRLQKYASYDFWRQHKLVEFDSLMEQRYYVVVASFRGAEYADDQPGFRYALDFGDEGEYEEWMRQVRAAQCYDTGIDCAFGDEFITLSTCAYHVKNGRFVVVARRLREGEEFENELPEK